MSRSGSERSYGQALPVQYVSFRLANQLLGVPVNAVQEVLNSQQIARIPRSRAEVAGLLNLRGQIVTAVDLRVRLGLPEAGERNAMNVVCRHDGESFSLLVDEVGDVIDLPADQMHPVPRTIDPLWRAVATGVYELSDELFVVLDVASVLEFGRQAGSAA